MGPNADCDAALFAAVQEGDLAKAGEALASGADVNAANPHGVTPLLEASGQGNLEMARFLTGRGDDSRACRRARRSCSRPSRDS